MAQFEDVENDDTLRFVENAPEEGCTEQEDSYSVSKTAVSFSVFCEERVRPDMIQRNCSKKAFIASVHRCYLGETHLRRGRLRLRDWPPHTKEYGQYSVRVYISTRTRITGSWYSTQERRVRAKTRVKRPELHVLRYT